MSIFGGVGNYLNNIVITQLRILVLDGGQQPLIYGPYGSDPATTASTFVVIGDIKSIFGYYREYLDGLGFFYVPWGVCGGLCTLNPTSG
jgi:hypothetical protein